MVKRKAMVSNIFTPGRINSQESTTEVSSISAAGLAHHLYLCKSKTKLNGTNRPEIADPHQNSNEEANLKKKTAEAKRITSEGKTIRHTIFRTSTRTSNTQAINVCRALLILPHRPLDPEKGSLKQ